MLTVKVTREPAISPRFEVTGYRLCKSEHLDVLWDDRCSDNGPSSRSGSARSLPVGPVEVVRLSVSVLFRLQWQRTKWGLVHLHAKLKSAPGTWVGAAGRAVRGFHVGCFLSAVAVVSGPPLTAASGEETHLLSDTGETRANLSHHLQRMDESDSF